MRKFWMSRKFWAALIVTLFLWAGYYLTIGIANLKGGHIIVLFATCVSAMTLMWIAFIGGTVWKDYIKSVHYKGELDKSGI
jgi:hypothetical protein